MLSILHYYKPIHPSLPNPSGHLSSRIPTKAIAAANTEVGEQVEAGTERKSAKKHQGFFQGGGIPPLDQVCPPPPWK